MKQIILLSSLICFTIFNSLAVSYEEIMKQNIEKMSQLHNANELSDMANLFERIGEKETGQWLPGYYAAYSYINILFFNQDLSNEQKQIYLDMAQKQIDKIQTIAEKESEVFVLQGMVYQMRISDPTEGYEYSQLSNEALAKAQLLNPDNPRTYYLRGMNLYYTPTQYGGGPGVAKPLYVKAASLFEKSKNSNSIFPSWGEYHNTMMLNQCKGN